MSRDSTRFITDRTRPFHVPGARIAFLFPFSGDETLLRWVDTHRSRPRVPR
ncbi:MAG TPA: hypothetical protein VLM76_01300 [Patescibacteria group bacterium]|nr:hypothetical protein [Patescibacteria group bacterium]